ncbi:MAG: NAD-binding protein [Oscillospiraceae bacterium]|nr:NAD-binding protein [Oscillospiraceae bacterium]
MGFKRFLSKLKKWASRSHARVVLAVLAAYTLICYFYWYVEIGPGGKKTFLDILLWNNVNIVFSRGFTDYIPSSWQGRALLMVLILFSMLFLSTIIGFVSSKINAYSNSPARRIKKVQTLSNHIVVFGWKNDIRTLIADILRKSKGLTAEDIVIVNSVNEMKLQPLLMDKEFKGIKYIRGDFTEEQTLLNANIKKAATALVLGEAHDSLDAELVDSRIFVCTLMIKTLNPRCHVCALVQTERYRNYLEAQHCDEVIYTEEYSRYILSTATSYTGMANVMRALFDNGDGYSIQIQPVTAEWRDKSYYELSSWYKQEKGILTLGVLENMGAEKTIKHSILADAMKSSNYGEIIQRLKTVKDAERNHPLLNPPDDFILGPNMGVIVLAKEI